MSDPFISQLLTVAFSWAPAGWATCNGQQLLIRQNVALFSLLGAQFGGDGQVNFNLPDFAGRTTVAPGTDAWGNVYAIGRNSSTPVTTGLPSMPGHSHSATFAPAPASTAPSLQASLNLPAGTLSGGLGVPNVGGGHNAPNANETLGLSSVQVYAPNGGTAVPLTPIALKGDLAGTLNSPVTVSATVPAAAGTVSVQAAGSAAPAPVYAPYLVMNVIIAMQGTFPPRP